MFDINKYNEILEILKKTKKKSQIIAISKNHPQESVLRALEQGVRTFGENRVIEAKNKFTNLKEKYDNIELHLTGPLQSNKVKISGNKKNFFILSTVYANFSTMGSPND